MRISLMASNTEDSREKAALVSWHHVFNVDVGILSAVFLHQLECLRDQITDVVLVLLRVVDLVPNIL